MLKILKGNAENSEMQCWKFWNAILKILKKKLTLHHLNIHKCQVYDSRTVEIIQLNSCSSTIDDLMLVQTGVVCLDPKLNTNTTFYIFDKIADKIQSQIVKN